MTISFDHITQEVRAEAKQALQHGLLVSSDVYERHQGVHPESGKALETPSLFEDRLVNYWTNVRKDHPFEEDEIDEHIDNVLYHFLPKELGEQLE